MGQTTNLAFLLLPEELLPYLVTLMVMAGGFLLMIGQRDKAIALVAAGLSLPVILLVVEAVMTDVFMALPEGMVGPVATVITVVLYASIGWSLLVWLVGRKAVDEAKGHLLADAIKWVLKKLFSLKGIAVLGSLLALIWMMS